MKHTTNRDERIFVTVFAGGTSQCPDPKLTFFNDESWFHVSQCLSAQYNRYWSSIHPKQTFDVHFAIRRLVCGFPLLLHEHKDIQFLNHCCVRAEVYTSSIYCDGEPSKEFTFRNSRTCL